MAAVASERSNSRHRDLGETVDALCRATEQLSLLVGRVAGSQTFEGVPQDGVARTDAVRREVALEHAAVGAERRDAGLEIGLVGLRQLLRRGRRLARMEVEHAEQHAEPAELDDDVLALAEFGDAGLPYREGFLFLVR